MFSYLDNIKEIDFSEFDFSKVTTMENMFAFCYNLERINFGNINTLSVVNMKWLFYRCFNLLSIDVSNFDTSKVTTMQGMFYNCSSLSTINPSNFKTSNVESFHTFLYKCNEITFIDLSSLDTSKATDMTGMFTDCFNLESINVSNFNTSNVETFKMMFSGCSKLTSINLSNFDTSSAVSLEGFFKGCYGLSIIDITNFNTKNIESLKSTFSGCKNLEYLDISFLDTSKVKDFGSLFYGCHNLKSLNLLNFNTLSGENMRSLFYECYKFEALDLSNFDTSSVTYMGWMFYKCSSLKTIKFPKIFNTSKLEVMREMFCYCYSLISLNLSSFDTTKVTDMRYMFTDCFSLKYLDIPHFSPNNLKFMYQMFNNMSSLVYLNIKALDINSRTNTSNSFDKLPPDIKICSSKQNMMEYLLTMNKFINCSDICFDENTKIDLIKKECVYSCSDNGYTHEFNKICYNESLNEIHKFIFEKLNFIDKCENDDTYKYEYNSVCYKECPEGTIRSSKKNYFCFGEKNIFQIDLVINEEIHQIIVDSILNKYNISNGEEMEYPGENNYFFQITNTENEFILLEQKNNSTNKYSIIDLGKCEQLLKNNYHINQNISLIILKYEKMTNISKERTLQHEIYEPYNKTKLDLSICNNVSIDIYKQVFLSEKTQNLYNQLKNLGYDLFDINSPFYNDICTLYKSPDNTDVLLSDRINYYFYNDDTSCQSNCKFSNYSFDTNYLKCECDIKNSEINTNIAESFSAKYLYQSFYKVLQFSNYKVLKCYKLALSINNITIKNMGSILAIAYFLFYTVFLIIYAIKGNKQLKKDFSKNIRKFLKNNNNFGEKKDFVNKKKSKEKHNKSKKIKYKQSIKKQNNYQNKKTIQKIKHHNPPKKKISIYNNQMINFKFNNNLYYNSNSSRSKNAFIHKQDLNKNIINLTEKHEYDNYELNNLEYNYAKKYDRRNFFEIYWSFIKREHLVVFTFITRDDHNITFVKCSRFFFLLCTDMAMNVFFFADETMHKIFLDYGKYNFIQQIPQIIYSTVVSQLIETFICFLSLTDKYFYEIKESKRKTKALVRQIISKIKIKIAFFYVFTFIMFIFYLHVFALFIKIHKFLLLKILFQVLFWNFFTFY